MARRVEVQPVEDSVASVQMKVRLLQSHLHRIHICPESGRAEYRVALAEVAVARIERQETVGAPVDLLAAAVVLGPGARVAEIYRWISVMVAARCSRPGPTRRLLWPGGSARQCLHPALQILALALTVAWAC